MVLIENFIELNSEKRFGRPILKNTRITVYEVLNWLANGMTRKDILQDFPELSADHIQACLQYAADKENKIRVA